MTASPAASAFVKGTEAVLGFPVHEGRASALNEVHARPNPPIDTPRLLIQLSFMTGGDAEADAAALARLAERAGQPAPDARVRRSLLKWGEGALHWERHTEFSTVLWEGPLSDDHEATTPFGDGFIAPGPVISGIRLEIRKRTPKSEALASGFDPASLCHSLVEGGAASIVTDFRQDGNGLTHILLFNGGLAPTRTGALARRLIDIENYRTLALLALPLAQSLSGHARRIEDRLAAIISEMRSASGRDNQILLGELTELAAEAEDDAVSSAYRFGAARAYDGIVQERLAALDEAAVPGCETWAGFLQRRMAPAMRTCRAVEDRQAELSQKLTRATTLLRTWVDVEVEKQNRNLLASMNNRGRLQLRLQQTVEGLSVAAVSYYVVGLIGYVVKGASSVGHLFPPELVTAAFVPVAVLLVWWAVRRIRHSHGEEHDDHASEQ